MYIYIYTYSLDMFSLVQFYKYSKYVPIFNIYLIALINHNYIYIYISATVPSGTCSVSGLNAFSGAGSGLALVWVWVWVWVWILVFPGGRRLSFYGRHTSPHY